jgi:hypothetical protein
MSTGIGVESPVKELEVYSTSEELELEFVDTDAYSIFVCDGDGSIPLHVHKGANCQEPVGIYDGDVLIVDAAGRIGIGV